MKFSILIVSTFILTACAGGETQTKTSASSWAGKMQKTARSFQELLPYIYNQKKFSDEKNQKIISKKISEFNGSLHDIDQKTAAKILGDDPYVLQSLHSLKELAERASDSFEKGDLKNSRILLKATTNTCFKCHTRQNMGPQTASWKNFNIEEIETDPIEKANLLVAMRQYEEAKLYLKTFLSESETKGQFDIPYENALHAYLMISLRGQNTFQSALNFIQAKALIAKAPARLHASLLHWQNDLRFWEKNKEKLKSTPAVAQKVLKRNKSRFSEKNLVNNLVASGLLHEFLMTEVTKQEKAKAYSLLGYIYDELVVEGYWDLPEVYYEMCIHYAPHTKLSNQCYKRMKTIITLGYTGTRGTAIPNAEFERLNALKKLAQPE